MSPTDQTPTTRHSPDPALASRTSSAAPNLLSIPRDIRDCIFSYCGNRLTIVFLTAHPDVAPNYKNVSNQSVRKLLLVCRQIRAEAGSGLNGAPLKLRLRRHLTLRQMRLIITPRAFSSVTDIRLVFPTHAEMREEYEFNNHDTSKARQYQRRFDFMDDEIATLLPFRLTKFTLIAMEGSSVVARNILVAMANRLLQHPRLTNVAEVDEGPGILVFEVTAKIGTKTEYEDHIDDVDLA